MIVLKFGGTSVGTAEAIRSVVQIVAARRDRSPVVVVSATSGTTDALIRAARRAESGDASGAQSALAEIAHRHQVLVADLLGVKGDTVLREIGELTERAAALVSSVAILRELTRRSLDAIVSYGERVSAPIVAAALDTAGIRAEALSAEGVVVTDERFGEAAPLLPDTRERVAKQLAPRVGSGVVPVVTGFIGATRDGVTTTLGRGGSDYSASILAAAFPADELAIYTDVNGIMSADPRSVPGARPLERVSYEEAQELSFFGAKVLHPRTVLPAIEAGIPVRILNTFEPTFRGTLITAKAEAADGTIVKATTSLGGLGLVTVEGAGMSGVPGMAARVFDTVAADGVSVLMISQSSSEHNICFVVGAEHTERLIRDLQRAFAAELGRHDVGRVYAEQPVAIVAAVGEGMKGTPGVAARVFTALGRAKINVVAIAQGSSELNISLVVDEAQRDAAVRAIHEEFHGRNARAAAAS
ncbi:MAG TPA: aspartate kinase [Candidatus Dormibacteraeota bacterium]|nr:aspartate kinase [Candidatus Dormibacteraeota bacterium]